MPSLIFSQVMTASGTATPLSAWDYQYLPWPARVTVGMRSTGAARNVRASIVSGSTQILPECPVQVGGTDGVTPSPLNTPYIEFIGGQGDRISINLRETAAATPTVDGIITVEPL